MLESWGHEVGLVMVRGGLGGAGGDAQPVGLQPTCALRERRRRALRVLSLTPQSTNTLPPLPRVCSQIMDTPRPEQIRPMQPDAEAATDEDCLELMEMILGALGRWAVTLDLRFLHMLEILC